MKEGGYIPSDGILTATISEKAGRWFISVNTKKIVQPPKADGDTIGVDLGLKSLAVCSDGRFFDGHRPLHNEQRNVKGEK